MTSRRHFLAGLTTASLASFALAQTSEKTRRLACNSWPFRGYFDTPGMHQFRDVRYSLLNQWDFPEFLADHFGIHNVEFLPQHFADTDPGTLEKVTAGLKKVHSTCCNLMGVDLLGGGVYAAHRDPTAFLNDATRWIEVAVALKAPTITIALNGKSAPSAQKAAANLAPVVEQAQQRGLKVLFHNDDMERESAEVLSSVIQKLGAPHAGTCPDFGNFAVKSAEYALDQLRILAPYASNICHAKDGIADDGKFFADDFPASMKVMQDAGFHGLYSLEFEGLGEPIPGVQKLKEMTEQQLA